MNTPALVSPGVRWLVILAALVGSGCTSSCLTYTDATHLQNECFDLGESRWITRDGIVIRFECAVAFPQKRLLADWTTVEEQP